MNNTIKAKEIMKKQTSKLGKVRTISLSSPNKRMLIDYLKENKILPKSEFKIENYIMLNIVCNYCGKKLSYYEYDELPEHDVECECSTKDKPVWLIKYED